MNENQPIRLRGDLLGSFQICLPEQGFLRSGETPLGAQQSANQNGCKRSELLFTQSKHG
jgi:hypothetical protein